MNIATMPLAQSMPRIGIERQPTSDSALPDAGFEPWLNRAERPERSADDTQQRPDPVASDRHDASRSRASQRKQDKADAAHLDEVDVSADEHNAESADASNADGAASNSTVEADVDVALAAEASSSTSRETLEGELTALLTPAAPLVMDSPAAQEAATAAAKAQLSSAQQADQTASVAVVAPSALQAQQQNAGDADADQDEDGKSSQSSLPQAQATGPRSDANNTQGHALDRAPGLGVLSNSAAGQVSFSGDTAGLPMTTATGPASTPTTELPQPTLPDAAADQAQQNVARIARGLQNALSQQGGSVTLRLTPPEMGTVRIQLQIQGATVNAQFHAESDAARTMLTNQISQLRHALEAQGLTVDRLNVQSMNQTSASNLNQQDEQSPSDGRSRGQYTSQQQAESSSSDEDQPQSILQRLCSQKKSE
jgi:flagellar hook-length control protein FliK